MESRVFNKYCSLKHLGNKGQQEKAISILQNRKTVTVKAIHE